MLLTKSLRRSWQIALSYRKVNRNFFHFVVEYWNIKLISFKRLKIFSQRRSTWYLVELTILKLKICLSWQQRKGRRTEPKCGVVRWGRYLYRQSRANNSSFTRRKLALWNGPLEQEKSCKGLLPILRAGISQSQSERAERKMTIQPNSSRSDNSG